jgi:hypothetical protein
MGIERRQAPRIRTSLPLGIRFPVGPVKEGWGRINNISSGGLLLETRFEIKVAQVLYLTFILTEGAKFENLRARVIRVFYDDGYYNCGLSFDQVVDKDTLRDVISALIYEGVPIED